jgi:hypothetical protein
MVPRLMGVRRKATIIGILAVLLTAATAGESGVYGRVVTSVHSFQRNFGDLKKADSMNPIERFVFSLILSNSKTPDAAGNTYSPNVGRT